MILKYLLTLLLHQRRSQDTNAHCDACHHSKSGARWQERRFIECSCRMKMREKGEKCHYNLWTES